MLLELRRISKAYPGVQALDDVSMEVAPGEVHALLGANGAGKSTLIKVLTGAVRRDSGEIIFDGVKVGETSPQEAAARGIAGVFQEPALIPHLTIAQNLFLGQERANRFGFIHQEKQSSQAREVLRRIAPSLSADERVERLRTSERQLVALAKAMLRKPKLLILDEPTASMTDPEIATLFGVIREIRGGGSSVIYITHRLEEVFRIADRLTVLRDGKHVLTRELKALNRSELVNQIAGREVRAGAQRVLSTATEMVLVVRNIRRDGVFANITFSVGAGEVVALAGLVGAGRTEIARAILAADPLDGGTIEYAASGVSVRSPADAVRAGIVMIPEDRKAQGLIPKMSVADNLVLSALPRLAHRLGFIGRARVRSAVNRNVETLDIRPRGSEDRPVETLSGGNQQKVLLARAIESEAPVLILDEPTAGVDIGAKSEIHRLVLDLAAAGKGILLISSETEEVLALADRILVIREGRMVKELTGHGATSRDLVESALGEQADAE